MCSIYLLPYKETKGRELDIGAIVCLVEKYYLSA